MRSPPNLGVMVVDQVASSLSGPPKLSGLVLALANMIPIIGVMLWGWGVYDVILLYWVEVIIIGLLHIPRMFLATGEPEDGSSSMPKLLTIPLFLLHFVIFWVVIGIVIRHTLRIKNEEGEAFASVFANPIGEVLSMFGHSFSATLLGVIVLFLSHLFSLFWNYIGHREYREWETQELMFRPYSRVVILLVVILLAAMAVQMVGSPPMLILVLIGIKMLGDFGFHLYSHAKAEVLVPSSS